MFDGLTGGRGGLLDELTRHQYEYEYCMVHIHTNVSTLIAPFPWMRVRDAYLGRVSVTIHLRSGHVVTSKDRSFYSHNLDALRQEPQS